MGLAQDMPSWGPTAMTVVTIAVLVSALVVLTLAWRNNRRR